MKKVNGTELAKATGYHRSWINKLALSGVLQRDKNNFFDLDEAMAQLGSKVSDKAEEPIDFSLYRSRKMRADALITEMEADRLGGKLVEMEKVVREVGEAFHVVQTKLLTIPSSVGGIVALEDDAQVCKEIIEGSIREALAELTSTIATEYPASGVSETSTEADGFSVG